MSNDTCWTIVRGAADGDAGARSVFARTYLPVVRAYLLARWRNTGWLPHVDDASQDVFVDCFRDGGALGRVDPERRTQFRTFLFGIVRNVALRYEERVARDKLRQHATEFRPDEQPGREERLSHVFDRAWARSLLKRAGQRQADLASDDAARRRVELLQLRFREGMPIRDIAKRWGEDAAVVHHEYARARAEFKAALCDEIRFHDPQGAANVERECETLLALLRVDA